MTEGIVYSAIARNNVILVSHEFGTDDYELTVKNMLPNILTTKDTKTCYSSHNLMYNILVADGLIYICAAPVDFGRRIPYAFLTEIKRRFTSGSLHARSYNAGEHEFDREFSHVLSEQMTRFNKGDNVDQVGKLKSQVEEVKGVMTQNIEKVLERGDRIDVLIEKTNDLESSSSYFRKSARRVQHHMWCKNVKMWIIICVVLGTIITIIVLMATGVIPVN